MRQEPSGSAGQAEDQIRFGSSREPRPRRPRARYLVAAVVIAVAVAVAVTTHGHARSGAGSGESPADQWYGARSSIATKALGHPLLDEQPGWELLAAGTGSEPGSGGTAVLVRIQFAAGLVTRTRLPPLQSNGPVFLIPGPGQVIFRPLDVVPGYLVPDNKPARVLPAALGEGGYVFPGPRPGQVWIAEGGGQSGLRLMTMNGAAAGQSIRRLPGGPFVSAPDGQGYVLVQGGDAAYDARPAGMRRVAAGIVAAVGSSAWLISRCRSASRCVDSVVNPATGIGHVLPGSADLTGGYLVADSWPPGLVSPNGRLAAVVSNGADNRTTMNLLDLRTGTDRRIAAPHGAGPGPSLAWSPDSHWLFWVTGDGALQVINAATGQVRGIGVALPPVTYLTISRAG